MGTFYGHTCVEIVLIDYCTRDTVDLLSETWIFFMVSLMVTAMYHCLKVSVKHQYHLPGFTAPLYANLSELAERVSKKSTTFHMTD